MADKLYFTAFIANDVRANFEPDFTYRHMMSEESDCPVFVIAHEKAYMLTQEVLQGMVEKWKDSLIPGEEKPVVSVLTSDATNAFVEWLENEPYGYIIPNTQHGLMVLPIFDVINL